MCGGRRTRRLQRLGPRGSAWTRTYGVVIPGGGQGPEPEVDMSQNVVNMHIAQLRPPLKIATADDEEYGSFEVAVGGSHRARASPDERVRARSRACTASCCGARLRPSRGSLGQPPAVRAAGAGRRATRAAATCPRSSDPESPHGLEGGRDMGCPRIDTRTAPLRAEGRVRRLWGGTRPTA